MVIKKSFVDYTEEDFDKSFNNNPKGAFLVMREAARCIQENGRIISPGT
ncbi:MAG: hypothetical protein AAGA18_09630 [Verrucomicrobiota bacterium]